MGDTMGSLAWGTARQGRMNMREKGQLLLNLLLARSQDALEGGLLNAGWLRQPEIALDSLMPAPCALVEDALALAQQTHALPLLHHSWRTYWLGALIGVQQQIVHDSALLFAAAILHDIGLTKGHHPGSCNCCFAISGGQRVHRYLLERGHPSVHASRVGEAIARHLNIRLSLHQHHPETHLLSRGALCDLVGVGRHLIAPSLRAELQRRFPREGIETALKLNTASHCAGSRGHFISWVTGERLPGDPLQVRPESAGIK